MRAALCPPYRGQNKPARRNSGKIPREIMGGFRQGIGRGQGTRPIATAAAETLNAKGVDAISGGQRLASAGLSWTGVLVAVNDARRQIDALSTMNVVHI